MFGLGPRLGGPAFFRSLSNLLLCWVGVKGLGDKVPGRGLAVLALRYQSLVRRQSRMGRTRPMKRLAAGA